MCEISIHFQRNFQILLPAIIESAIRLLIGTLLPTSVPKCLAFEGSLVFVYKPAPTQLFTLGYFSAWNVEPRSELGSLNIFFLVGAELAAEGLYF